MPILGLPWEPCNYPLELRPKMSLISKVGLTEVSFKPMHNSTQNHKTLKHSKIFKFSSFGFKLEFENILSSSLKPKLKLGSTRNFELITRIGLLLCIFIFDWGNPILQTCIKKTTPTSPHVYAVFHLRLFWDCLRFLYFESYYYFYFCCKTYLFQFQMGTWKSFDWR